MSNRNWLHLSARLCPALLALWTAALTGFAASDVRRDFTKTTLPTLKQFCLDCHSTEKQKGDLDLERFKSADLTKKDSKVWQQVIEQLTNGEMPPEDKPQPTPAQKDQLLAWTRAMLHEAALANAGDPGPVVLRRLSNAEYTYTIRDLTGVASLDPAREFPVDGAAGEGFMNAGAALVMSPSLVTKYLDAAKSVASHAVLLPDGIAFSSKTTPRDWTEEKLAAIRALYGRYARPGGGTSVNLQGIKFDTKDGGVIPLEKYLRATLELRNTSSAQRKAVSETLIRDAAAKTGLSPKYLSNLWSALNDSTPSMLLDPIRAHWRAARPGEESALVSQISQWQQSLWRFTTVGHIGKRDGPKAWQVPVLPLASAREVRFKLPSPSPDGVVTFHLITSDAGDGNTSDFAVWQNPRLVAPGRPDLLLRDVRSAVASLDSQRTLIASSAAKCLQAASEAGTLDSQAAVESLARNHGVEAGLLSAWLDYLGIGGGPVRISTHMTQKLESAQNYDFVRGWVGPDALSVIANSSDQHVRVPGNMKPHGVAVHPTPKLRVAVGWSSPVNARLSVDGVVQHAHPECGNGVTWSVELRRGNTRQILAAGATRGAALAKFGQFADLKVEPGDLVSIVIGPKDGNHSCDLTAVDLKLAADDGRTWDLAKDVSPNILAGNPHADSFGNASVWHFYSEPDKGGGEQTVIPAGSLLAKWRSANKDARQPIANDIQQLLRNGAGTLKPDHPDAQLLRQLTSVNGPLLVRVRDKLLAKAGSAQAVNRRYGVDPQAFGRHPTGSAVPPADLCVQAPSVIEVRLPSDLAEGCEFVATTALHAATGVEGSVQMLAQASRPAALSGLTPGGSRESGAKSTWSDGERAVVSDSPILVTENGATRDRILADMRQFRALFPAALCYTKIVPVDEVVTLTLYYREDDQLKRLMLSDAESAELDRLWKELHFVSQDAFKLVDAFEQLWQFATQDANPSAFEPLREPIKQRAAEFKQQLLDSEPRHVEAVLELATRAWRRPLTSAEQGDLRALYAKLRSEELPHEQAIRLLLARVLTAPAFLYRVEEPGSGRKPVAVSDVELATRLSYFLWSTLPDVELSSVAASGQLHKDKAVIAQSRRMLKDERVRRMAIEFACQWLHIRDFDTLDEKSERHFPTFNALRGAMYEESIRFFTDLFQNDGSVLAILDADYTFLNEPLAKHYGIPESALIPTRNSKLETPNPTEWRRVDGVRKYSRGGILAQATTLSKQSGASRTSPILRGNWISEVLLGERLPRPPKGVPTLPEEPPKGLTERQLIERHSGDPACVKCHQRIDPMGFSLENFDAIGRFRERSAEGQPIDTSTELMDGTKITGLNGLRDHLLNQRRDAFVHQFCRKLIGYALGRGVLLSDEPLIDEMMKNLRKRDYRFSAALETVVLSRQFREIRGTNHLASE